MLESSVVYKIFARAGSFMMKLINGSFLVNFFLKEDETSYVITDTFHGAVFSIKYTVCSEICSAVFFLC